MANNKLTLMYISLYDKQKIRKPAKNETRIFELNEDSLCCS